MDLVWGNFWLVIGAMAVSVFVGWVWKNEQLMNELAEGSRAPAWLRAVWFVFARFICPVGIFALLVNLLVSLFR